MICRKAYVLIILLFTTVSAYSQSEALKTVVNNLAFYRQKTDLKYLANAKKSVDSLIVTRKDSVNLEKNVYKAIVYASIAYVDSLNKLKLPADFIPKTASLVDRLSSRKDSYKYQPEIDFAKRNLANVFIRQGFENIYHSDFNSALQKFQKAQQYAPAFSPLNAYIGYAYSKNGNLTEAAKYYQNLLKIDGSKPEYIEATANIYKLMGDTSKALDVLSDGRKLLPSDKNLLNEEADIYISRKSYKSLSSLLPQLLDANSSNAETAFIAADCYDHLNQTDKAESMYMRAIELNSSAYAPVFNLGVLYLKQSILNHHQDSSNNIKRATQWLERANEMAPNDVHCLQLLQKVYAKTGNNDQLNKVNERINQLTN